MGDAQFVNVCYAGCHLRKLSVDKGVNIDPHVESMARLTKCKRFTSGFDRRYSVTLPFGIHSETIRKYGGFSDTETPNKDKIFG